MIVQFARQTTSFLVRAVNHSAARGESAADVVPAAIINVPLPGVRPRALSLPTIPGRFLRYPPTAAIGTTSGRRPSDIAIFLVGARATAREINYHSARRDFPDRRWEMMSPLKILSLSLSLFRFDSPFLLLRYSSAVDKTERTFE